jgi:CBS domain-containing protein
VEAAVAVLETGRHRIYPVVDEAGRPIGMVTRADALRWKIEGGHGGELLSERVSDKSLAVVHPDDVVTHVVDVMLATDQGRIPVVDPGSGTMVGLVSRKDLLQVRATVAQAESERAVYFSRAKKPNPENGEVYG